MQKTIRILRPSQGDSGKLLEKDSVYTVRAHLADTLVGNNRAEICEAEQTEQSKPKRRGRPPKVKTDNGEKDAEQNSGN